jgi:25S rRNA (uracil2634-N3)-methyltransferase
LCRSWKFHPDLYPGYAHRRTLGFKEGTSVPGNEEILRNPPRTYCFTEREEKVEEKATKKVAKKEEDEDEE